jgi:hypothetical protein
MNVWTIVGRLALSFVLGGLIGWEREHEEKTGRPTYVHPGFPGSSAVCTRDVGGRR